MTDPLFWLVLSLLFVTISLTIMLVVAIPALRELARASRSAEKLFDTLRREFPPTLQAIRLTGLEISDLTDDVSEGVQSAGQVVKQVDQSLTGVRNQAHRVQSSTRSLAVGIKAAWRTFTRSPKPTTQRRSVDSLSTTRTAIDRSSPTRENSRPDTPAAENPRSTPRRAPVDPTILSQNIPPHPDTIARPDHLPDRLDERPTSATTDSDSTRDR